MCSAGQIVVAYRGGLYDMTNFSGHPGGVGRLQMAAGNDLEVYWKVYTQHNRFANNFLKWLEKGNKYLFFLAFFINGIFFGQTRFFRYRLYK